MEIWDLYDENRKIIGEHTRGLALPKDAYHLVVHIWIKNKKNQFLISQRSADRPTFPLMWETTGGSVLKGESSFDGAIRETKEEVGIDLSLANGNLIYSALRKEIDGKKFNDILDVWLFDYNGEINLNNATTNEVACAKWMNMQEIHQLYINNKLVKSLNYIFDLKEIKNML